METARDDLAKRIAERLEALVSAIKSNPIFKALKGTAQVLPLIPTLILGAILFVIFAILALTRLFNVYVFHERVWATYLLFAFIFFVAGLYSFYRSRLQSRA